MAQENKEAALPDYSCFTCRELSWLKFNLRVLEQAADRTVPVLERLKFLSIYYSNLDEFFMVRVGSITHRMEILPDYRDVKTGWDAAEQLRNIFKEVHAQQDRAEDIYKRILKDLSAGGIEIVDFRHMSKVEESIAKKIFAEIRPMLSPNIVDPQHPWPFLGNLEEYIAVMLGTEDKPRLGIIALNRIPPFRVYETNDIQKVFIMSELIKNYAPSLFRKYTVRECVSIRVTRNADVLTDDLEAEQDRDFRKAMETMLRKRKRQMPVRLQVSGSPSKKLLEILEKKLPVGADNIFSSKIPLSVSFASAVKPAQGMKYPSRSPVRTVLLRKGEYFKYLRGHDILLSFPYQSINPFIEMLYEAADDPDVVSIKITLYRLASSSKLAAALAYAADCGKHVECMLELRARFDEQNNIDYSEMLEEAGCKVYYGLKNYKVHCKVCAITRNTPKGTEYFTQIGTGNYNEVTSEQYCDISVITSDPGVGRDAQKLFEALSEGALPPDTESLLIAPNGFRPKLAALLEREKAKGTDGYVSIKVNSLNDYDIMQKIIECSQAGNKVELFVRGICCLRPGISGYTDNVTVKSVVGRHLEHSRIYIFGKGDDREVFIGSGDLLNRNTQRRVEVFVPVRDESNLEDIDRIMDDFRNDGVTGKIMTKDGDYVRDPDAGGKASHDTLYSYFVSRKVTAEPERKPTLLERIKKLFGKNDK